MDERKMKTAKLAEFIDSLLKQKERVIAPVQTEDGCRLQEINEAGQMELDFVNSINSVKEFFFPKHERVLDYEYKGGLKVTDIDQEFPSTVIIGSKPCDAATLPILDKVFTWDYDDKFYLKRREATVIVSQACVNSDEFCFCNSVGLSPHAKNGSDVIMYRDGDTVYFEANGDKGSKWLENSVFEDKVIPGSVSEKIDSNAPEKRFDIEKIKPWLDKSFEQVDFWKKVSERCIGCGVCTFSCPTCHCFDIVDQGDWKEGCRLKTWDSCSFGNFTMHTSGHNPRTHPHERWRQRIMHKFKYYNDKFDETLCSGCGRCVRKCPVTMGVLGTLMEIDKQ